MNLTHCPLCNTRVHSTHRCHALRPDLIPMPEDFRSLAAQARTEQHVEQLALLDEDDTPRGQWPATWPRYTCPECGHTHTPTGCTGAPTPSDLWAGVSVGGCDCEADQ